MVSFPTPRALFKRVALWQTSSMKAYSQVLLGCTHFAEIGAVQQINGEKGTGNVFDRMFERLSRELPEVRPTLRNG